MIGSACEGTTNRKNKMRVNSAQSYRLNRNSQNGPNPAKTNLFLPHKSLYGNFQRTASAANVTAPKKTNYNPVSETIAVKGRQILVNGKPYQIKGVCYNPVPIGQTHPEGVIYKKPKLSNSDWALIDKDISMMAKAGINSIRTFEPITNRAILDKFHAAGIKVINTVFCNWNQTDQDVLKAIREVKDHPAILTWMVGNEWNYNFLYHPNREKLTPEQRQELFIKCRDRLNHVTKLIKQEDPNHPVSTSYSHIPKKELVDSMPDIDIWGSNIYAQLHFDGLFEKWKTMSGKPVILSEYGADAWNTNAINEDGSQGRIDLGKQADAVGTLSDQINKNSSAKNPDNVCAGGVAFAWNDEWWKRGNPWKHDTDGGPGGLGPYPDGIFNDEWWGLVDIHRNPRPAYEAIKIAYNAE
jgi:hypothetical protein